MVSFRNFYEKFQNMQKWCKKPPDGPSLSCNSLEPIANQPSASIPFPPEANSRPDTILTIFMKGILSVSKVKLFFNNRGVEFLVNAICGNKCQFMA